MERDGLTPKEYLDPHIHAGASACSLMSDRQAQAWFDANPRFVLCVSDHMSWEFYHTEWAAERIEGTLFATEITLGRTHDFVLMTYDLRAFSDLSRTAEEVRGKLSWNVHGGFTRHNPLRASPAVSETAIQEQLVIFADPRILVTFAHPPLWSPASRAEPDWLPQVPVDFLEYNAVRLAPYVFGHSTGGAELRRAVAEDNSRLLELRERLFPEARFIVGSDSHQRDRLGTTYVEFDSPLTTGREAWDALRACTFEGVLRIDGLGTVSVDPESGIVD